MTNYTYCMHNVIYEQCITNLQSLQYVTKRMSDLYHLNSLSHKFPFKLHTKYSTVTHSWFAFDSIIRFTFNCKTVNPVLGCICCDQSHAQLSYRKGKELSLYNRLLWTVVAIIIGIFIQFHLIFFIISHRTLNVYQLPTMKSISDEKTPNFYIGSFIMECN